MSFVVVKFLRRSGSRPNDGKYLETRLSFFYRPILSGKGRGVDAPPCLNMRIVSKVQMLFGKSLIFNNPFELLKKFPISKIR